MNNSSLLEFHRKCGNKVYSFGDYNSVELVKRNVLVVPYHRSLRLDEKSMRKIIIFSGLVSARWLSDLSSGRFSIMSGVFICDDQNYDLGSLDSKARNQTRRGIDNCNVIRISAQKYEEHSWQCNVDTLTRQRRAINDKDRDGWHQQCMAVDGTLGSSIYGAFVDDVLVAFCITVNCEDCAYIVKQSSRTSTLGKYPNNALTYIVTTQLLKQDGINSVNYGTKSVEDTASLDTYKVKMGYQLIPMYDNIAFHPLVEMMLTNGGGKLLQLLMSRFPGSDLIRKAASIAARGGL